METLAGERGGSEAARQRQRDSQRERKCVLACVRAIACV